jgi:acyl carrier protein
MDKKKITEELKSIIHVCLKGRSALRIISEKTDLIKELNIDSIEALEILLQTEEKFGITIDDEDLNKELFRSMETITNYINQRVK